MLYGKLMNYPNVGAGLTHLLPKPARLKLLDLRRDFVYTFFLLRMINHSKIFTLTASLSDWLAMITKKEPISLRFMDISVRRSRLSGVG
jgi:hypothetical protein